MENTWNIIGQENEIPTTEPQRQYYFIKKAKEYLEKMSEAAARPRNFFVKKIGCQIKPTESEKKSRNNEHIR